MSNRINLTLKNFHENLFQKDTKNSVSDIEIFFSQIQLPTITFYENYAKFETDITEDNLFVSIKSTPNNKSRGNDGLFKEFCETFWEDMKAVFINSLKQAKMNVSLSISQRQVVKF